MFKQQSVASLVFVADSLAQHVEYMKNVMNSNVSKMAAVPRGVVTQKHDSISYFIALM